MSCPNSDRNRSTSLNQSAAEIVHGCPRRSSAASPAARTACSCGARLNYKALGFALSAVIRVRPAPRQLQQVADVARTTSEVVECQRITGEDCYV